MKPNWDDAPEWANYVAQDADGGWWWFEFRPKAYHYQGRWMVDRGRSQLAITAGKQPIGPMESRP